MGYKDNTEPDRGVPFVRWAKSVKIRDQFECTICHERGIYLEAHHLFSWNAYPDFRLDIDCGVTLCKFHHTNFHDCYGYGNNDIYQFQEYKQLIQAIKNIVEKKDKE